tara:strand:- start:1302 stop:2072 length:771 start_codon:yes stop_codon:yes gene_type:complete
MSLFDLTNKVAVVTGSTRGIGRAIASEMAMHGARVVISSRKVDACKKVATEINSAGGEAIAIPCNISKKAALKNLFSQTRKNWKHIDILVSNAAVNPYLGPTMETPDHAFEKVMATNVKSNQWMAQMVGPEMAQRKDGVIIIISSIGGLRGSLNLGAYAISKAADMQMARNLAVELGPSNVRVNCIAPGLVKTDFARALWENPKLAHKRTAETPLRRLGDPRDIAGLAIYLASQAGAWTTGQTLVVDGGVTAMGLG